MQAFALQIGDVMKTKLMMKCALLVSAILSGVAQAAVNNLTQVTGHVTIQDAIDNAVNGDVIEADPATYVEAINFNGKAITLRSASGDPIDTIIDGNGAFHVVQCVNSEGANTVLEGFTITGGNANGGPGENIGGGMRCVSASPTITHCIFRDNMAAGGGGLRNESSSPTVTDCMFLGNTITVNGGGMNNVSGSNPLVVNCIFSGNTSTDGAGGMFNHASDPTVINCTFSGNSVTVSGGGMRNANNSNPVIHNCIFWGNSDSGGTDESAQIHTDSGAPTVNYSDVQGGWTGAGANNINADPLFINADGADNTLGTNDDNLRLPAGSPAIDAADNTIVPGGVTTDLDGLARFIDHALVADTGNGAPPIVDMGAYENQTQIRVHNITQATGHETLQDGIDNAINGDIVQADPGTYAEAIDFNGKAIILRSASGDPNDTIIDGSGNSHVVLCVSGEEPNTVLAGFTITGGDATGTPPGNFGGGMRIVSSSPTVDRCTFSNNAAKHGGGLFINISSPSFIQCHFTGNRATDFGGGMYLISSNPVMNECVFDGNESSDPGAGMHISGGDPVMNLCVFRNNMTTSVGGGIYNDGSMTIRDSTFTGNSALNGGGIYNDVSPAVVARCSFTGNTATFDGGGMYNVGSNSLTVGNCVFNSNMATDEGGGMYNGSSDIAISHCSFVANSADDGGAIYNINSSPSIVNSILQNNIPNVLTDSGGVTTVDYCNIQGGYAGTGNIDADPLFVDADGTDNIPGNGDDDLHLQAASPCIDAGDSLATQSAGLDTDRDGNARAVDDPDTANTGVVVFGLTVDMGAYEFQPVDPCDNGLDADLNCDGIVNELDFALMALHWLETI
jgi:hypothetical protein